MGKLSGLSPEKVFEFFELLSSVPHGSGNTDAVCSICVEFAKKRGLRVVRDGYKNVIIYKPASAGYENSPGVILQAHLDMVCAKSPDDPRDMKKVPVDLRTDGEWVWADGTSLGGDDISGVAMAMAVLDDDSLPHPAIEALFTSDEETGMDGAFGLDPSLISGRLLINLDSEEEGVITAGCSGGIGVSTVFDVERAPAEEGDVAFDFAVSGLRGGHSGGDIHLERANSNMTAARVLYAAVKRGIPLRLDTYEGGSFGNVITGKTVSRLTVPGKYADELRATVKDYSEILADEYAVSDPGITLSLEPAELPEAPVTAADTARMLGMLISLPYGVQHMSTDLPGLVETSLNLGVIKLKKEALRFSNSIRSCVPSRKHEVADRIEAIVAAFGGRTKRSDGYPEWKYRRESRLRELTAEAYRQVSGKEARVFATHGGLECGIFSSKLPGLDAVSIGPDLVDIHSTGEKMSVTSVGRTYRMLCELLALLK